MNLKASEWTTYAIEDLGISFQSVRAWPVLPLDEPGYAGVYQPIADTSGIAFVRYGKGQTVNAWFQKLGGMSTDVSILSDKQFIYRGKRARRLTVALDTPNRRVYFQDSSSRSSDKTFPAAREVLSVIGFRHRGIPVLAGYRIPEPHLKTYESILEQILNSVSANV